jgi:KDO2-lipid IV(A) lauroyltransferase
MSDPAGLRSRTAAWLTDTGFAAGWRAVRMLPEPVARGAFDRAGRWAAGREGKGVRQLRANLRVATGGRLDDAELDALTARGSGCRRSRAPASSPTPRSWAATSWRSCAPRTAAR